MFNSKLKQEVVILNKDLADANKAIDDYRFMNKELRRKNNLLEGDSFKYKVTKALLEDDEAILELLEDTLMAAAKKDIEKGIDIRAKSSFFYRLVNEQANKIVIMFNNGEIK